ncbi:MAG: adenylosuccinate synthase, partial [Candidatus Aenigmarchaeota archaeon]|nr:adenylosuccinate synthase [Candidatus Aenigmarchaeota archaeon]
MPIDVVVGMHWGDEGKGKIVDVLAADYDVIARYQGGENAGHTVYIGDTKYVLHVVPSGVITPDKIEIIGNGTVINLASLVKEIEALEKLKISTDNLFISDSAHLLMPYHRAAEQKSKTSKAIDTTAKGIGPAYADKTRRAGIRLYHLRNPRLLEEMIAANAAELGIEVDAHSATEEHLRLYDRIADKVVDTRYMINDLLQQGKQILSEGAQGTLLDLDHGTYPYVTSSNPTAGGAATGLGVPPKVRKVIGVMKGYITRVGSGPFPTELGDPSVLSAETKLLIKSPIFGALEQRVRSGLADDHELGQYIRAKGDEYGATTGRPRRTGWQDLLASRYARMVNGVDMVAVTKMDILDQLPCVKVATSYRNGQDRTERFDPNNLNGCMADYTRGI